LRCQTPTLWGNADGYQNKGVEEKAIRKTMKTKGEQFHLLSSWVADDGHRTPGVLAKEFGFA
jgi:hypothetical protein